MLIFKSDLWGTTIQVARVKFLHTFEQHLIRCYIVKLQWCHAHMYCPVHENKCCNSWHFAGFTKTSSRITPINYIPSDNDFTIHILVTQDV